MLRILVLALSIAFAPAVFAQAGKPPAKPQPLPSAAQPAASQADKDVETIFACLDVKAPEDVPEKGPERDKILAAAEGGPQACIGQIIEECQKAKGKEDVCIAREASAWLNALNLDDETRKEAGEKNVAVYNEAATRIEAHALALCRAAASVSGWGSEAIKTDSKELVFNRSHPCMLDAIVQQSLIVLVNQRGG